MGIDWGWAMGQACGYCYKYNQINSKHNSKHTNKVEENSLTHTPYAQHTPDQHQAHGCNSMNKSRHTAQGTEWRYVLFHGHLEDPIV
jgi:hypothetical protein